MDAIQTPDWWMLSKRQIGGCYPNAGLVDAIQTIEHYES